MKKILILLISLFILKIDVNAFYSEDLICSQISNEMNKKVCNDSVKYSNYNCDDISYIWKILKDENDKEYVCDVEKIALTQLGKKTLETFLVENTRICKKDYKTLLTEKRFTGSKITKISDYLTDSKYNFEKYNKELDYYLNCFKKKNEITEQNFVDKHTIFSRLQMKALHLENSKDLKISNKQLLKYYINNYNYQNINGLNNELSARKKLVLPSTDKNLKELVKIYSYTYNGLKKIYEKDYKKLSISIGKEIGKWVYKNVNKKTNIDKDKFENSIDYLIEREYKNEFEVNSLFSLVGKSNIFNSSLLIMNFSEDLSWYLNSDKIFNLTFVDNYNLFDSYANAKDNKNNDIEVDNLAKESLVSSYLTLKANGFSDSEIKEYIFRLAFILIEKWIKES